MSDQCEKLRVAYENARAEVVKFIANPGYTKEKCDSLFNRALEKKDAYIQCLYYSGIRPIPILWVPACPYKEGPPEYLGPEAAAEYGYEPEPTPTLAYSGVHARMFPFPLVIARLANFRDIYQNRHAWFKRLHDLLHPLI